MYRTLIFLGDLVRTRAHDDNVLAEMPEFWVLVLKLMDDIKESVRKSAAKTAGKVCFGLKICQNYTVIRFCMILH